MENTLYNAYTGEPIYIGVYTLISIDSAFMYKDDGDPIPTGTCRVVVTDKGTFYVGNTITEIQEHAAEW